MYVPDPLVLGTRGSQLALWQANFVKSKLEARGHRVELQTIQTTGDRVQDVPVSEMGDESVFTKELDRALLTGDVHLAVHSLKDVPSRLPAGIGLAAITDRADPRDAFVAHPSFGGTLHDLPEGATVATASLRRKAQLMTWRNDLRVVPVRGNVDTRLDKLDASEWHGIILATAGLVRMGLSSRITTRIDDDVMLPAVGQAALGVACAQEERGVRDALEDALHHEATAICTRAERAFLQTIGGGCQVPTGAWGRLAEGDAMTLEGTIASLDGTEHYRERRECSVDDAEAVGRELAQSLLDAGGDQVIREILGDAPEPALSPFRP